MFNMQRIWYCIVHGSIFYGLSMTIFGFFYMKLIVGYPLDISFFIIIGVPFLILGFTIGTILYTKRHRELKHEQNILEQITSD